jgi:hypothetical protein
MNKNVLLGVLVGAATAVVFGLGGFLLLNDEGGWMGGVLFILLPVATGFATALVARQVNVVTASLIIGLLLCTAVLLTTGKEGWVCVLMSAPLIAGGLTIGACTGFLIRKYVIEKSNKPTVLNLLMLAVIPLFLMGANSAEQQSRRTARAETVTSTLIVDALPEKVWDQLKSMDKIGGSKGLLMRIGLPVPVSCVMDHEGVGGKRTCYFDSGYIEERITEWNPPNSMKLEITASDVPGRPWLTFRDASYDISRANGRTIVTRKTTIISRLSPVWYWRRLEEIGVETEHQYLFEELKKRINGAK